MRAQKKTREYPAIRLSVAAAFLLLAFMVGKELQKNRVTLVEAMQMEGIAEVEKGICMHFLPLYAYTALRSDPIAGNIQSMLDDSLPLYGYTRQETPSYGGETKNLAWDNVQEALDGGNEAATDREADGQAEPDASISMLDGTADRTGNLPETSGLPGDLPGTGEDVFIPHDRVNPIDTGEWMEYEALVKACYTIDTNTMAGSDQLNVEKLLGKDLTLPKDSEGPQILIYHTHSQEAFADSTPGDIHTSIMGVGERLAQILTQEYGYQVLHYTGQYDVESRDDAYSRALPEIEQLLADNPSIQVVIDLHRDEMEEGTRLVTDLDGRPTARFMFFNGLSWTRKTGQIAYLYNENLESNLAFSFQMQLAAMEYYPGLTRKIYLKGYRYNMHLRPRYLLIELGAQNNTVEEAMNACEPLAHILDLVLSGEAGENREQ